ncbi:MAG: hypothetical protein ACXVJD_00530 [Mucilaginibacter sp.]
MTHTIENVLVMAALFIIIFIPIYLAVKTARTRKRKKIMTELALIEKEHHLFLQAHEQFDTFIIAIDQAKKLIVKMSLNDYSPEFIDLKGVTSCLLEEKKQGKAIQQIRLKLSDNNQPVHYIVFYQQYVDNEGRLKRNALIAAQWEVMINAIIDK